MSNQISNFKRNSVYLKYNGRCAYCGCEIDEDKFTIDHIVPIYRKGLPYGSNLERGDNSIENLNPCCLSCNCSKSTFTLDQWRKELELKRVRLDRDNSTFRILKRYGIIKEVGAQIIFHFEKLQTNGK